MDQFEIRVGGDFFGVLLRKLRSSFLTRWSPAGGEVEKEVFGSFLEFVFYELFVAELMQFFEGFSEVARCEFSSSLFIFGSSSGFEALCFSPFLIFFGEDG